MSEWVADAKIRRLVAGAGAIFITVVLLILFRLPAPPVSLPAPNHIPAPKAVVKMAKAGDSNRLLQEEAELRDLRPLFLPTERNAALPDPRLEPGRTFLDNETLKFSYPAAEANLSRDLPAVATIAGGSVSESIAANALGLGENELAVEGFGRGKVAVPVFKSRGGYVEVTDLKDGRKVWSEDLTVGAKPPSDKSWSPVEFIAAVDTVGLVSPLLVNEGSRVEEVDSHFRNYLARTYRIGDRLSPGFYRITVAP